MEATTVSHAPGTIRDSIVRYLRDLGKDASATEITAAVNNALGEVPPSSVRSYLQNNNNGLFVKTARGKYRLSEIVDLQEKPIQRAAFEYGKSTLFHDECFNWLQNLNPSTIHAVVTDPPYGLLEYTEEQQSKLRTREGGVWRIPPSFDGHQRSPLPRFTVLKEKDIENIHVFFRRFGTLVCRACTPGANILVASNPLLAPFVAVAMSESGLEIRGTLIRQVMTMRGGDRPKNAHDEFSEVSVMPRSMYEPWVVLRKPLEGRVQDNLRKWNTGGFRRPSTDKPFGDLIKSTKASRYERSVAPHPSLKPQAFLRTIVRASLPLGKGIILDPFAGSGSTLAACNYVGYESIGVEKDPEYLQVAKSAIPELSKLSINAVDPI